MFNYPTIRALTAVSEKRITVAPLQRYRDCKRRQAFCCKNTYPAG